MLGEFLFLWLWRPWDNGLQLASLKILREIAVRTTNRSGAPTALASCHLIEQLSICLWRSNSHMFLHLAIQFVACQPPAGVEP